MTRCSLPVLLTLSLLLFATVARAQEHQHGHAADTSATQPPGEEMKKAEAMMQAHERMMADATVQKALMADSSVMAGMRSLMHEMMGEGMNGQAMHERMEAMAPAERKQHMTQMHTRMRQRMQALSPDERAEMMQQMMAVHHRMMQNPVVQERMQADPELRRMMEEVMEGMDHDGMDHDGMEGMQHDKMEGMKHDGMNHDEMEGMDNGRMQGMQHDRPSGMSPSETREAEAASHTADRFREALAAGDRAAVEALLLPDAVVLEGGRSEARAEYLGHHFGRDAAFLAAVEHRPLSRRTSLAGEVAWVTSTSRLTGAYDGRPIDVESAELLVLRRDPSAPDGWRIAAVHWSSQATD